MEMRPSTSRYILTTLCVVLVFTAILMVALNALHMESFFGVQTATGGYNAGYEAARAKYSKLCPMIGQEQKSFSGTITALSDDRLTIQSNELDSDPSSGLKDTRVVSITNTTIFQSIARKPQSQLIAEMQQVKPGEAPPSPFIITTTSLKDLKVGDTISISVQQDARTTKNLTAVSVSTQLQ